MGPDPNYIPILDRGTSLSSNTGLSFVLTENVDFADPKNEVVVFRVNPTTGAPTHYGIKAYGNVVSGDFAQKTVTVGPYERFRRISLAINNYQRLSLFTM